MTLKTQIIDGKKKWTFEMSTAEVEVLNCYIFNHMTGNCLPVELVYMARMSAAKDEVKANKLCDGLEAANKGQRMDFSRLVLLEEARNGVDELSNEDLRSQGVPI